MNVKELIIQLLEIENRELPVYLCGDDDFDEIGTVIETRLGNMEYIELSA